MTAILPGTEVVARGLRWEVVFTEGLGPQTLYRLRGLEGALHGQELDLLHPFEPIEPVQHDFRPDKAAPLRNWLVYHQAFLLEQALGPDALLAVQPGRLRIEPYQLVPVLRALRMSRPRLLLADGVGLGKTIQAGLVLTELIARRLAHRILIVSPAGPLLEQWRMEMAERFGLRLTVIDRSEMERIRRSNELGANPFDHIALGLASIDFLKQEPVLELLERGGRTAYDVVVVDEAHHCMDLGAAQEREDSQRRRLAQVLAEKSDALLLLTATPHDGNDRSFASLCELLDRSLVDGRGVLRGEKYRGHVVRRLKRHVPGFKERVVKPVAVSASPTDHHRFMELQRTLLELVAPELKYAFRRKRYSDVLAWMALLKRSVSTVEACRLTLGAVRSRLQALLEEVAESQESRQQRLRTLKDYQRRLERFGALSAEEEEDRATLEAEDLAQQLAEAQREVRAGSREFTRTSRVVETLDHLVMLAEAAKDQDPKLHQLRAEVQGIRTAEPEANILIYTEYVDSQRAAARALEGCGEVLTMWGDDGERKRSQITERFRSEHNVILISTDAAAEGLNLHQRCHHLIHLELPFNPNRLEQRNGRIDRYGQPYEPIVRYLYLARTFEENILLRLIAKYERQRKRLTFVPNTLGLTTSTDAGAERLLRGLMDEEARLFKNEDVLFDLSQPREDDGADAATRDLLEEIERTLSGFERAARTHTWLLEAGLNAEEKLMAAAGEARSQGRRLGRVDLADFVCDALLLDGGDVTGSPHDGVFQLRIPPSWSYGLDDLPGYDPESRTLMLTTDMEVTSDAAKRPVGFLGRAHPLVRRTLDRVRNLSFGGTGLRQDVRVSAVRANVPRPTLLLTFLGRIQSRAGRELEQVLAVTVPEAGTPTFFSAWEEWRDLAKPEHAILVTDVWSRNFAVCAETARARAEILARDGFAQAAARFAAERRDTLEAERRQLLDWLSQRTAEITGVAAPPRAAQLTLLETEAPDVEPPSWSLLTDPVARLTAYSRDGSQPASRRTEAESAHQLFKRRAEDLEARLALATPELIPIGMLMLLPEMPHGV